MDATGDKAVDELTDEMKAQVILGLIGDRAAAGDEGTPDESTTIKEETKEEIKPKQDVSPTPAGPAEPPAQPKTEIQILEERLEEEEKSLSAEELEERHKLSQQLKADANNLYKNGDYDQAAAKYSESLDVCPLRKQKDRSILYANKAAALMGSAKNEEALPLLNRALELDAEYFKALERRARLNKLLNHLDEALKDYEKLLEIKPRHCEYLANIAELKERIRVRNEEMQAKMMDSLKQLGNVFLKPFGLSTDNFKMQKNPDGTFNMQMGQPE